MEVQYTNSTSLLEFFPLPEDLSFALSHRNIDNVKIIINVCKKKKRLGCPVFTVLEM
jgi:hypothetical protein